MSVKTRLLGLAFASSDLLLEIDGEHRITLVLGSGPSPELGLPQLEGRRLHEILMPDSASRLATTLQALRPGTRSDPIAIDMTCGDDKARHAFISLFMLPDLAPAVSCSLRYEGAVFSCAPKVIPPVLTAASLLTRARALLTDASRKPGDVSVTFVDMGGLAEALASGQASDEALARIEASLQSASIDGNSAARLTTERYALMHDPKVKRDIAGDVRESARQDGIVLDVSATEQALPEDSNPLNTLRAMRFAVESCLKDGGLESPDAAFSASFASTLRDAEAFRAIVRERRFDLHYQPIVDLQTGTVHHFEALARFSKSGGPTDVIHMAEELALIEPFDLAVAAKAIARLRKPGAGLLKFAVNISGASLANDAYVEKLLEMTSIDPDIRKRLIVEVTETAALADIEAANRRLGALRRAGIHACIDDFGSGASSYDYLHGLSVDTVKIDGRFVQGIERDERSRTLVKHLIDLCGSLKLTTIAEMIETEEAASILKGLGVDHGQGWLYGRAEAEPRTSLAQPTPVRRKGVVEAWG